ncbi:hypothetical protein M430DRAFT_204582 [Amorphotheca resinae ATCC 22711]|uniref:Uncharacterized protein n=1 Tax=Amorphotheca resinae ATCC 22711 TaxID=857342 RepID=A0A2T3BBB4_AMORE|nr:hypothetical protein M430DRAFT_204582 [Amorphotheca resinae ATCC 22711]PSS25623.1 hypothetical protein M430DRAFT_204582 [Amorphotheca resinae ATCC 22711]
MKKPRKIIATNFDDSRRHRRACSSKHGARPYRGPRSRAGAFAAASPHCAEAGAPFPRSGGARRSQKEPEGAKRSQKEATSEIFALPADALWASVLLRAPPYSSVPPRTYLSDCAAEGTSAWMIPVTWSRADNTPGTYGMYTSTLR